MFNPKLHLVITILGILAILGVACAVPELTPAPNGTPDGIPSGTPDGTLNGTLQVYVTDAPPRNEVTSIMVTIEEVQIHRASAEQEMEQEQEQSSNDSQEQEQEQEKQQTQQGEGEWITIDISDDAATFDLLQVKGVEQFLGESEVAEGKYTQVRLVVGEIQVALGDEELQEATVPSKELKLVHPFDVVAGENITMILDFDADRMVTVTGAGKIMVKPVIKLTIRPGKPEGQQGEQKSDNETSEEISVKVSCDEFMSAKHISKEVEVNTGDEFKVILCSNPSTGFQWSESAAIGDTSVIEQTDYRFVSPEAKGKKPAAPGTPGQGMWTFKALTEGTTTISMEYSQPWEGGEKGEWTFNLTVVVK